MGGLDCLLRMDFKLDSSTEKGLSIAYFSLSAIILVSLVVLAYFLMYTWRIFVPIGAVVLILGILGWFIRGGAVSGSVSKQEFKVNIQDQSKSVEAKEGADLLAVDL